MSTENWKLEKDLCRCCHAEGSFYNLGEPRFDLGQEEVYSDMLRHSFNIDLSPVSGILCAMTYTICEKCILRLRDASNFKRQVLLCEERFKDMYRNIMKALSPDFAVNTTPSIEVKQESPTTFDTEIKEELAPMSEDDEDVFDSRFDNDEDDEKTVLEMKLEDTKKNKGKSKPKPKAKTKKTKKVGRPSKVNELEGNEEPQDLEKNEEAEEDKKKDKNYTLVDADGSKKYLCLVCGQFLASAHSIRQHMIKKHTRPTCQICKQEFETNSKKTQHLKLEHGFEQAGKKLLPICKSVCDLCEKEFSSLNKLKNHIVYSHRIVKCSDCSESFRGSKLALHRHEVHGAPIPTCEVCGYKNPVMSRVITHQRKQHLMEKNVKCEICSRMFFDNLYLKKHMICHSGERKYECTYCSKKFARKKTLLYHIKIHTGEKNKVCSICDARFVQKASLNYHMMKHHPEAC